jgi:predicted SnoaL-like aldol condensation-catalyzing enzyme
MPTTSYNTIHRVLAEGNFVLSVCEGTLDETHCSFYDLYRIDNERLVEHWNTVDAIPPRNEWNNDNGKF